MNRTILTILCLLPAACASTPPPPPDTVEVITRPVVVEKSETIDIEAKRAEGLLAYETRDYEASFDAFTQILLEDNGDNLAWLGRANAALALGLDDDAYDAFLKVNSSDLNDSEKRQLLTGLTLLTVDQTQNNDHERRLLKALVFADDDIRLWNALGRHYDQTRQWQKSTDVYVEALSLGRNRDSIVNNLGISLMYQGRYDEARDKFKQAQLIDPESEVYNNNLRLVDALSGQYNAAIAALTPKRAALVLNDAGVIAWQRGDKQIAKLLLTRAIALSPVYHAKAHSNLEKLEAMTEKGSQG